MTKFVTPELTFVASGTPPVRKTFVNGARPPIGVRVSVSEAPKQRFVVRGVSAQLGLGLTMFVALQELVQPFASLTVTV